MDIGNAFFLVFGILIGYLVGVSTVLHFIMKAPIKPSDKVKPIDLYPPR